MYSILAYLKFLLSSTNQHGVHSPFIFKFVTQCLYDKTTYKAYENFNSYRKQLISNKNTIEITDLGAGSRIFKSTTRAIKDIVKHSGSTFKKTKLLYRISRYFNPENSLELGTSLGIGTLALSRGAKNNPVLSVEGCGNISEYAKKVLKDFQANNITLKVGTFDNVISKFKNEYFDLIFIDGHHTLEATLKNFNALLPYTSNDSIIILDDIYWSKKMARAWTKIKSHPKVTVTVDCFHLGIVFLRKEQGKEHFKIRV